jgi:hypothetical protein
MARAKKTTEEITTRIAQKILDKVRVIKDSLPVLGKEARLKARAAKKKTSAKASSRKTSAPKKKTAKAQKKGRRKSVTKKR